jgi:hypothetical protein
MSSETESTETESKPKIYKLKPTEEETLLYSELFVSIHLQLAAIQKKLGPDTGYWERRAFRSRHKRIRLKLENLIQKKGGSREEAENLIEQNLAFIGMGKQGWAYISAGEIDYLQGILQGLET